jgi:hypothetical protein
VPKLLVQRLETCQSGINKTYVKPRLLEQNDKRMKNDIHNCFLHSAWSIGV